MGHSTFSFYEFCRVRKRKTFSVLMIVANPHKKYKGRPEEKAGKSMT